MVVWKAVNYTPTTMKKALFWLFQFIVFCVYFLLVYNLAIPNAWLSFFIALLLVIAFTNSNRIRATPEIIATALMPTFNLNDDLHRQHTQEIEELKATVEILEEQVKALEDRLEELEPPTYYNEEIV